MTKPRFLSNVSGNLQRVSLAAVGAIALGLSSCTTPVPTSEAEAQDASDSELAAASGDALQVVTTFLPITQFTTAVAGDRAEVVQLLPTNVGPHDYQAKPGDVQAIATADVLIKNGLEMELFLDDMIENAENADLAIIDSSEDIATLSFEEDAHADGDEHGHAEDKGLDHAEGEEHDHEDEAHAEGEDHDHGEDEAHAESEDHDHGEDEAHAESEAHGHAHGEFDPHIWLDPKRAIEQVENIRDGLIAADPEGEAEYTANAEAFMAELDALDADITAQLEPFAGQTFVVFHDYAAYFADSYGLQSEMLVGIPEENPSPEDVKRVMETVQAEGLKTILTEPQSGKESFETIANDLNISVGVFDPLETGDAEATQPDYYLTVMRQNADSLVSGFETSEQAGLPSLALQPVAVVPQYINLQF